MMVCVWLLLSAGCGSLVLIFCAAKDSHDAAFGMGRHYDSHPLPVGSEDDEDTLDDAAFGAAGMPLVKQLVGDAA